MLNRREHLWRGGSPGKYCIFRRLLWLFLHLSLRIIPLLLLLPLAFAWWKRNRTATQSGFCLTLAGAARSGWEELFSSGSEACPAWPSGEQYHGDRLFSSFFKLLILFNF